MIRSRGREGKKGTGRGGNRKEIRVGVMRIGGIIIMGIRGR